MQARQVNWQMIFLSLQVSHLSRFSDQITFQRESLFSTTGHKIAKFKLSNLISTFALRQQWLWRPWNRLNFLLNCSFWINEEETIHVCRPMRNCKYETMCESQRCHKFNLSRKLRLSVKYFFQTSQQRLNNSKDLSRCSIQLSWPPSLTRVGWVYYEIKTKYCS